MAVIPPVVRHMLVCDDVTRDPDNPERLNVLGLISAIDSGEDPPFPLRHPQLSIFLQMTNGRGSGMAQVLIREADTDQFVSAGRPHRVTFPKEPLLVHGAVFRLLGCLFPRAGLYYVEFWFDGEVIAEEPLLVRGE